MKSSIWLALVVALCSFIASTFLAAEQRDLQESNPVARSICTSIETELIGKGVTVECFIDERSRVPGEATILVGVTASVEGRQAGANAALKTTAFIVADAEEVNGMPITHVLLKAGDPVSWTISVRAIRKCMELFSDDSARLVCFDRNTKKF